MSKPTFVQTALSTYLLLSLMPSPACLQYLLQWYCYLRQFLLVYNNYEKNIFVYVTLAENWFQFKSLWNWLRLEREFLHTKKLSIESLSSKQFLFNFNLLTTIILLLLRTEEILIFDPAWTSQFNWQIKTTQQKLSKPKLGKNNGKNALWASSYIILVYSQLRLLSF